MIDYLVGGFTSAAMNIVAALRSPLPYTRRDGIMLLPTCRFLYRALPVANNCDNVPATISSTFSPRVPRDLLPQLPHAPAIGRGAAACCEGVEL